eukprot:350134-Chlamydomonas_euryale.AAC.2
MQRCATHAVERSVARGEGAQDEKRGRDATLRAPYGEKKVKGRGRGGGAHREKMGRDAPLGAPIAVAPDRQVCVAVGVHTSIPAVGHVCRVQLSQARRQLFQVVPSVHRYDPISHLLRGQSWVGKQAGAHGPGRTAVSSVKLGSRRTWALRWASEQ